MIETGNANLDPAILTYSFGLAVGNSLYLANQLLCDPHEAAGTTEIRQITGNIGKAGLSVMIPPVNPAIAEVHVKK
jgi:hypothetical protein